VAIRGTTAPLGEDDPLRPIFTHSRELGEKDLHLALALGEELAVDLPLAALALEQLGAALGVPR
jgi:3-hydroxyisobutyrate dehydrogenase